MINILYSKKLNNYLYIAWLLMILYGVLIIPPRVDDGIYLLPAINELLGKSPSIGFSGIYEPIFFIFPTQSYLHGQFLKLVNFFGMDLSLQTYRTFNGISTFILLLLIKKLFDLRYDESRNVIFNTNLTLITLGFFSQFSFQFFINRPEIIGLVFYTAGLIYTLKALNNRALTNDSNYAGIFTGLTSIVHPHFFIIAVPIQLYLSWQLMNQYSKKKFYLNLLFYIIPILFYLYWILLNFDSFQDQVLHRTGEVFIDGLALSLKYIWQIISENLSVQTIYLKIYMLTFVITILGNIFLLFSVERVNTKNSHFENIFKITTLSMLFILLIIQPFRPYFMMISFLSIISLISLGLGISKISIRETIFENNLKTKFIYLIFILMSLSMIFSNETKRFFVDNFEDKFSTQYFVETALINEKNIFITSGLLIPYFSESIVANKKNIIWFFPTAVQPSEKFKKYFYREILNYKDLYKDSTWGLLSKEVIQTNYGVCANLKLNGKYLNLKKPKLLFSDRMTVFLKSINASIDNKCLN